MVYLFYGPSAQERAQAHAHTIGRLVHPALGGDGLKVDDARLAVSLLSTSPVGDKRGVLILGPMDQANTKASDVLLKKLEEPTVVTPVLWAGDLEGVRPTIKSRTSPTWCPGVRTCPNEDLELANKLLDDFVDEKFSSVYEELKGLKQDLRQVLEALVSRLAARMLDTEELVPLWAPLREQLSYTRPTRLGVWAAFLEGADGW